MGGSWLPWLPIMEWHGKVMTPMRLVVRSVWLLLSSSAFILPASDGGARTGDLTRDPADLVRIYVTLDSKGTRLDSMSYEALRPYVNWSEEPAWGHAVVIDGVEVVDDIKQWQVVSNTEVVIPVRYRKLGAVYWHTASFIPEPQVEMVGFRVKAVTSRWKIIEPLLPPHVNRQRFLNHVRLALLEETNPLQRQALDALQAELKRLK
jgi:hypothetical protein